MAPRGKRFFHKPENLSSIPRTLVKKMLLKAHLCNPNTGCGGRRMPRLAGVQVEQEILCARARGLGEAFRVSRSSVGVCLSRFARLRGCSVASCLSLAPAQVCQDGRVCECGHTSPDSCVRRQISWGSQPGAKGGAHTGHLPGLALDGRKASPGGFGAGRVNSKEMTNQRGAGGGGHGSL